MDLLDRIGQKLGESVGLYSRTADEDESFVRQERLADATREATEKLLKTLTPESSSYLNSRTLATFRTQKEEKQGTKLLQIGKDMQQADMFTSLFGIAVEKLGETMQKVGTEHSELDNRLMISTIDPLKSYSEGQLKEILNLKKRYDANRLDYDAARRNHDSKKMRETEDKMHRARQKFDEARIAYFNRLIHSQDDENEHVTQLQAYAAAQAIYFRKCAEHYDALSRDLGTLATAAPDRPRPPPMTLTYSDQTASSSIPPASAVPAIAAAPGTHSQPQLTPALLPTSGPSQHPPPSSSGFRPGDGGPRITPVTHPSQGGVQKPGATPTGRSAGRPLPQAGGRGMRGPTTPSERCRALYDFQAERPTELSLRAGDVVVIKHKAGEWWEGEMAGRQGFFPASYVQLLHS